MIRRTRLLTLAAVLACTTVNAQLFAGGLDTHVDQVTSQQKAIKAQTQLAAAELDAVIGDFDEAGMGNEPSVQVFKAIRSVLTKLSDKDMEKVITLLQGVRADAGTDQSKNALDAYANQKGIVVQLRQLVLDYQRQQTLLDMSLRLTALADRQNANLHLIARMIKDKDAGRVNPADEAGKAQLRLQQAEQDALHDETMAVVKRLGTLTSELDSASDDAARLKAAVDQVGQMNLEATFTQAGAALAARACLPPRKRA